MEIEMTPELVFTEECPLCGKSPEEMVFTEECPLCGESPEECKPRGIHCEECNCVIYGRSWFIADDGLIQCSDCYISWFRQSFSHPTIFRDVKYCGARPKRGIDATYAWLIVARRLGFYRDLQLLIAKLIWDGRFEDFY